ncbi:mucin-2 [Pleuronectes platessa]|uniref:mucin-2 n=1 Tax=Pleuronectes platessa TaxID=8262 RepID=UPI00232A3116|nr:mucin-2 [Pleuronectes platessa]
MFYCCAEDGDLHISNVQWPDGGEYYCNAENRAGRQQRRTILTVTDQDPPTDRLVLSDSISTNKELPVYRDSLTKHHQTTHHPYVEEPPHGKTTCSSSICETTADAATTFSPLLGGAVAELTMSLGSRLSPQHLIQPSTNPSQLLATQIQHPVLTPAPHPNFQSVDNPTPTVTDAPVTLNHSLLDARSQQKVEVSSSTLQYQLTENQFHLASSRTNFPHQVIDEVLTSPDSPVSKIHAGSVASQTTGPVAETSLTQSPSQLPVSRPLGFLKFDSYLQTPAPNPATQTISGSVIQSSQSQSHRMGTESIFYQFDQEPTTTLISRIKLESPSHLLHPQPSPAPSQTPHTHPLQFFRFLPKFHLELLTTQPHLLSTQPPPSSIPTPQTDQLQSSTNEPYPTISTLPQTQHQPSPTQHPNPSISTLHPRGQTSGPSTLDTEIPIVPQLNISDKARLNVTRQGDPTKSANDTKLTEWLKRNTSQSPMTSNDARVTQQSPSWLPLVEKHDIPIVVGVGVSLAFIFITVTFYAVVQKNEAAPANRAAPRNVGEPVGDTEHRAAGRTYENRAFEDDDCVAVIEQSPNTSDTRARPPGPSLVTVQMEPTFEDQDQEDTQPTLDNHSVTVETYPEPILDTKIDPEDEKRYSLSQPSIQLQSSEDWTSNRGDDLGLCHDALPPPSSLPSRSPSPSPPSRREEGLRSSVTLQSAEHSVAPIHHSLSVSHGNPPLLLSHHVSLGLTTVAVDVHFYPAATASTAGGSSSHISTVSTSTSVTAPLVSPPFVNSRESNQSTARSHK